MPVVGAVPASISAPPPGSSGATASPGSRTPPQRAEHGDQERDRESLHRPPIRGHPQVQQASDTCIWYPEHLVAVVRRDQPSVGNGLTPDFADAHKLKSFPLPLENVSISLHSCWHRRFAADPGCTWMRDALTSLLSRLWLGTPLPMGGQSTRKKSNLHRKDRLISTGASTLPLPAVSRSACSPASVRTNHGGVSIMRLSNVTPVIGAEVAGSLTVATPLCGRERPVNHRG